MAEIRKLKSGLWQATVWSPSGRRYSKSDPLKRVVREWAEKVVDTGEWPDVDGWAPVTDDAPSRAASVTQGPIFSEES